jgi:hypothetical protein
MTPDELASPPRKRRWKRLIVALACVVAVTIIALLANTPKKEPVKVWFVRATNEMGEKKLVFQGTNGIARTMVCFTDVVTGATHHAKAPTSLRPSYDLALINAAAGTSFTFTLSAPPKGAPYYVEWSFHETPRVSTRWGRFRTGCCNFFIDHGMPRLARRFAPTPETHYIPSTEFKE